MFTHTHTQNVGVHLPWYKYGCWRTNLFFSSAMGMDITSSGLVPSTFTHLAVLLLSRPEFYKWENITRGSATNTWYGGMDTNILLFSVKIFNSHLTFS